jgi:hypothetical protein
MSTLDEIVKEKQRIGEAVARADAQREKLTTQLSELEATERVLARYSKGTLVRRTASATATKAAALARQRGRRRTTTAKAAAGERTSPSLSDQVLALANRQDTAGNRRFMQRRSPEPCRRRHRPAQAGWPHRRARREALRETVGRGGATCGGLTTGSLKNCRLLHCPAAIASALRGRRTREGAEP